MSVWSGLPAPGWTTSPTGLSSTRISASSCRTSSGSGCASGEAPALSGGASVTASPPCTACFASGDAPSTRRHPSFSQACSRLRENCGNTRASAWSNRNPANSSGIAARISFSAASSCAGVGRGFESL